MPQAGTSLDKFPTKALIAGLQTERVFKHLSSFAVCGRGALTPRAITAMKAAIRGMRAPCLHENQTSVEVLNTLPDLSWKAIDSHPVLTCAEAGAWERRLLKGESSEWAAMQKAGEKIAQEIIADFEEIGGLSDKARLLVLVGKGHNGGDALLAARWILERYPKAMAEVVFCFGESLLRPLAKRSFDGLCGEGGERCRVVKFGPLKAGSASYDLCLDGVFGFQFRPPMDKATARMIAWINAHPRIKFSCGG